MKKKYLIISSGIIVCIIAFIIVMLTYTRPLSLPNLVKYGIGKDLASFEKIFHLSDLSKTYHSKNDEIVGYEVPMKLTILDRNVYITLYTKDEKVAGFNCPGLFFINGEYKPLDTYDFYMELTNWARENNWELVTDQISSYRGMPFWEYCPTKEDFEALYVNKQYSGDGLTVRGNNDYYAIDVDCLLHLGFTTNDGINYRVDVSVEPREIDSDFELES